MSSSFRRATDVVLATIFLVVICLPAVGTLVPLGLVAPLTENRAPAERPPLAFEPSVLRAFHRDFERYWNDAFGFRPVLVRAYNALAVALGTAPSDQVVIGKAGWWFVGDYYRAVEYQRAAEPFTHEQLESWRKVLEARQAWLATRGIRYLCVIVPDKGSIYPEYFPTAQNRVGAATRLDQLLRHLLDRSSAVRILDVRDALSAMKASAPVYEPLDSHWNDLGAWVAYAAIVDRLHGWFPQLRPLPLERFEPRRLPGHGNDLAMLLSLGTLIPSSRLMLYPREPRRARWLTPDGAPPVGTRGVVVSEVDDATLPRAVMFNDSFGEALRPFLSEHFARIAYAWQNAFDPEIIERERPAVVLHEMVERSLMLDLPAESDEVMQAAPR